MSRHEAAEKVSNTKRVDELLAHYDVAELCQFGDIWWLILQRVGKIGVCRIDRKKMTKEMAKYAKSRGVKIIP